MNAFFHYLLFITIGLLWLNCSSTPQKDYARTTELPIDAEKESPKSLLPDARRLIVALGDSLTAGLGVDPAGSYPSLLQKKLDAKGYRYRVVNAGVSGDTSSQGLNRLVAVREQHPAIVLLALGANDGLRGVPVKTTAENLDAIITSLKDDGIKVVLLGMQMPPNYGPEYTRAFRAAYFDIAGKHSIPLVPFMLEGVAGKPEFNQDDGVHPTAKGYEIIAENVWKALEPLLDRVQS